MERSTLGRLTVTMVLIILGGIGLSGSGSTVRATDVSVNMDLGFFYDRLASYGDWREHARWGWVWYPRGMPVDWRPYTFGHWVYTDDFGWMWDSDEEWGWACFHYGRWDWDDEFGWYWVPGYHWGPGWVAWRTTPEYIGWCPLPPEVRWEAGVGLAFGGFDLDAIPARRWVFVEGRFFDTPRLYDHVALVSRNVTLLHDTRAFVGFERVDGRIVDHGISVGRIEEFTHRPVTRFHVRYVCSAPAMRVGREHDGEIAVFNPRIREGPAREAPPRPEELERRQRTEREQLQEQQRAELSRQQERHHAERAAPGVREGELQSRQEAERGALQAEHQRQSRLLENRQQQQRQEFQRSGRVPEQRERRQRR